MTPEHQEQIDLNNVTNGKGRGTGGGKVRFMVRGRARTDKWIAGLVLLINGENECVLLFMFAEYTKRFPSIPLYHPQVKSLLFC